MPMSGKGLVKLLEEIAELQKELAELGQVAAKKLAYIDTDEHPDGAGSLHQRLTNEMGDVLGAVKFVASQLGIAEAKIGERAQKKFDRFVEWDKE